MHLQYANQSIRLATADDAATLCRWWNDGVVMAHAGFPHGLGTTPQKVAAQIASQNALHQRMILEIDGAAVGEMSYRITGYTAEIGIKICVEAQREKGYGTRFLLMLISWLFAEKGVDSIVLDTNRNNARAQHVYEKIGFVRLGVREGAFTDQLGDPQSVVDYRLEKSDFARRYPPENGD